MKLITSSELFHIVMLEYCMHQENADIAMNIPVGKHSVLCGESPSLVMSRLRDSYLAHQTHAEVLQAHMYGLETSLLRRHLMAEPKCPLCGKPVSQCKGH